VTALSSRLDFQEIDRAPLAQSTSRASLEQEYGFIEIISTFLRAIRAGAIHPRHGAVLLAHYGRLSPTFDSCCKVVVDVLREEGMYNDNGEMVAMAMVEAIQEVRPYAIFR
jgi:cohesin complex subunit SA-1/2